MSALGAIGVGTQVAGTYMQYQAAGLSGDAALAKNRMDVMNAMFMSQMYGFNAEATKAIAAFNAKRVLGKSKYDAAMILQQGQMDSTVAFNNAKLANINAGIERENALYEAERIRDIGERLRGTQEAQFGASGVQLSGSAEDVMMDSSLQNELEALVAIHSGEMTARGLEYEGEISKWQGASILTAAKSQADATLWYGNVEAAGIGLEASMSANALMMQAANSTENAIALSQMSSYIKKETRYNQWGAILNGVSGVVSQIPGRSAGTTPGSTTPKTVTPTTTSKPKGVTINVSKPTSVSKYYDTVPKNRYNSSSRGTMIA